MKRTMNVKKSIFAFKPHVRIIEVNAQTRSIIAIESFLKVSRANYLVFDDAYGSCKRF